VLVTLVMAPFAAQAQVGSERYSSLVIDAESDRVLLAAHSHSPRAGGLSRVGLS